MQTWKWAWWSLLGWAFAHLVELYLSLLQHLCIRFLPSHNQIKYLCTDLATELIYILFIPYQVAKYYMYLDVFCIDTFIF